jgi:hypothetical protein
MLVGMDNMYLPPAGGAEDSSSTQQLGPAGAQHDQAGPGARARTTTNGAGRGSGRMRRIGIGITVAAVLVGGGVATAVGLTSGGSPAAAAATLSSATSPTAAAAHPCRRLAAELLAAGHPREARAVLRACRPIARLFLTGGIHGQVTFEGKKGARTVAFERGVVESVSPSAVVVRAKDGTTWTWELVSDTVVREHGKRTSTSALSDGERVWVGGPLSSGSNDARLILIRPASAPAPTPTPTPSSAAASAS